MATPAWERKREEREEKLDRMRELVASGELVVRQMTRAERARWASRQREFEANSTPEERARRANAADTRLRRAQPRAG